MPLFSQCFVGGGRNRHTAGVGVGGALTECPNAAGGTLCDVYIALLAPSTQWLLEAGLLK